MNPDLLEQARLLWNRDTQIQKFQGRLNVYPSQEGARLAEGFHKLDESIPSIQVPLTTEDVYTQELKRRAKSKAVEMETNLSGKSYAPRDIVQLLGIEEEDITSLRGWLESNKPNALDTIERVYQETSVDEYTLGLPFDQPHIQRQAPEFVANWINTYQKKLGRLLEELTSVGSYMRDINTVPTLDPRSYFNTLTKTLAIGVPAVTYMTPDGSFHINQREMIRLFGHEGMGHGVNHIISERSSLPFFFKEGSSATVSTVEAVAQFYERQVFDDLANSPETQEALDIAHKFPEIYQEEKDLQAAEEYIKKFFYYAINVLADKELGDPQDPETMRRKVDVLAEVALYPGQPASFVNNTKDQFDYEGNLSPNLVSELRYVARPIDRALQIAQEMGLNYQGKDRSKIDSVFFTGLWTPIGFVQNAKVQLAG